MAKKPDVNPVYAGTRLERCLYLVDELGLSVARLAGNLDQMRLGLVHGAVASAEFVIEDLHRETAEVFSRLQLGGSITM